jgi:hypothetical protein
MHLVVALGLREFLGWFLCFYAPLIKVLADSSACGM